MLRYDEADRVRHVGKLGRKGKVAFALLCATRLMPQYRRFQEKTGRGDARAVEELAERLWQHPAGNMYGNSARQIGPYWTRAKPSGPVQSIVDSALRPEWGNTATKVVKIEVPAGQTIYEGTAAAQGGLVGGGNQVFIPKVDPSWVVK